MEKVRKGLNNSDEGALYKFLVYNSINFVIR